MPRPAVDPKETSALRRVTGFLLTAGAALPLLTALYVALGLLFVFTDYTLNDEGLLTYYWASWARQEFVAVLFFQRVRPVLSALYLPASLGGLHSTLVAHVILAALSLPMLAATARALGQRLPNLPALGIALSPLYFYGGAAGFSNVDGVVGISLALYLLCARRRAFLAGLVAGLLPWVRGELLVFCACFAAHGILSRRDRLLLAGMATFPLLYAAAGACYHHDALWVLHFPPSAPSDPSNLEWKTQQLLGVRYLLEPLLAVTPLAPLIVAVRPVRLQPLERTLLMYLVVGAVLVNALPILRLANFGTSPRYSMCLLPALLLLIGRVFGSWWQGERQPAAALVAVSLFALWLATRQQDSATVAFLLIVYALLVGAASFRFGTAAAAMALVLVAAGPLLAVRREVGRTQTAPYLEPMSQWLATHRAQLAGPILTNSNMLAAFLESRVPGLDVRFVAGPEMTREVVLTNAANGQRERIRRLAENNFYGRGMFASITPDDVPPGALLVLRNDVRLSTLLPEAVWGGRLDVLEATPQYRIARLRRATPDTAADR